MLHGYVFVPHGFGFIFSMDQDLIQIIAHIQFPVSADLRKPVYCLGRLIGKQLSGNVHPGDQLQDQAVLQGQQAVKQMLLLQLLVAVVIGQFLTVLYCFHRFLGKFIDIHIRSSFGTRRNWYVSYVLGGV